MKLARIHGPNDVRLDEVPEPVCGPDDAILDVAACGICGSDVGYAKIGGIQVRASSPFPIGHELAGVVAEIGKNVRGVKVGTRVALHPGAAGFALGNGGPEGGFARRLLVRGAAQGKSLFQIPDSMSFEQAALAEPLGVGMHAVDQANLRPGDKVAVLGAGAIGLSAAITMLDRGIDDVCLVDLSEARLDAARKLGVPHVVHSKTTNLWEALGKIHGTQTFYGSELVGTNVFIEATGSGALLEEVVARCAPDDFVEAFAVASSPDAGAKVMIQMR